MRVARTSASRSGRRSAALLLLGAQLAASSSPAWPSLAARRVRGRLAVRPARRRATRRRSRRSAARSRVDRPRPGRSSLFLGVVGARVDDVRRVRDAAPDLARHDARRRARRSGAFLVIINPLLVTFVPAAADPLDGRRAGRRSSSAIAMPLMGLPVPAPAAQRRRPGRALLVTVFVIGEMLWVPTSQAAVAAFAPADIRGAYMGFFGGSWRSRGRSAPFLGLQVRTHLGRRDDVGGRCRRLRRRRHHRRGAVRGRRVRAREPVASARAMKGLDLRRRHGDAARGADARHEQAPAAGRALADGLLPAPAAAAASACARCCS